jgi:flagellar basal-body rod modification protein FlgD
MAVGATSSVTNTNNAANNTANSQQTSSPTSTLDYSSFLKLLTAQMKFQDPTNPTDPTQFVSQLASFSSVEQGIKTNTKLDSLITSQALNQADGLLGKTVTSVDGTISGVVKSVEIYSDGSLAVLENGQKLLLGPGVKISETPPPTTT